MLFKVSETVQIPACMQTERDAILTIFPFSKEYKNVSKNFFFFFKEAGNKYK